MKISISADVFRHFHPGFRLALLSVTDFDNKTKLAESIHVLHDAGQVIRLTHSKDTAKTHHLLSPRNLLQYEAGKHYHTAAENLLKKVLAGRTIAAKDVLSNILRAVSLERSLPMSADDADLLQGNITFALSKGGKIKKGEVYYQDTAANLGTTLDYWKNQKTVPSAATTSALIHMEAVPPVTEDELKEIISEIKMLIRGFCGGRVKTAILDIKKRAVSF